LIQPLAGDSNDAMTPPISSGKPTRPSATVNNSEAYQAACLAGLGIIQVPLVGVKTLLPQRAQVFMNWMAQVMAPHVDAAP
jgi:hypothetical protein